MISNAIPGITDVNTFANTNSAKGIAASNKVSKDFQQTLNDISSQKKSAAASVSITRTITNTASQVTEMQNVKDTKTVDTKDTTNNVDTDKLKTDKTSTTDTTKTADASKNTDNAETSETEGIREGTNTDTSQVSENTEKVNTDLQESTTEETVPVELDEAAAALMEAARQLMEMLSDELQVDLEDIQNAMETLGLTNIAILDNTNMTQLIAELNGAEDVMAIVTNADLYMSVQDMQDAVDTTRQELMEQFDFSEEEFNQALEDFAQNMPQQSETSEKEVVTNPINDTPVVFEITSTQELKEANKIEVPAEEIVPEETGSENTESSAKMVVSVSEDISEDLSKNDNDGEQELSDGGTFNQMMNQISSSLTEVEEPQEAASQTPRTTPQEIMDQITESIKLNITEENTRMELQLHPASLGTVNVMIEQAKDGEMVAKFMTHNEDVRAAIESQLQQLQERFNEQGVKVTAIEVTVNTGGFDQSLNDSQSQKEDDQDAQNSIRKPMRRIHLGDLSLGSEELIDEEDQLTAEMMAINGNMVDFSA